MPGSFLFFLSCFLQTFVQPKTLNFSARTCEAAVILVGVRAFLTTSVVTPGRLCDSIRGF